MKTSALKNLIGLIDRMPVIWKLTGNTEASGYEWGWSISLISGSVSQELWKSYNACIIPLSRLDLKSLLTDFYPLNSSLCKVLMLSFGDYLFQEIAHSLHPQSSKMLKYRWKFQTPIQLDSSWLSLMMWPLTLTEFWQRLPPVLSGGCSLITNKECRPEWALA